MSIEDGYFLGRALAGADLADYASVSQRLADFESPRRPHTARHTQIAYALGKVFHHVPGPLRRVRDAVFDHTPLLQKLIGESNPKEILAQLEDIERAEQQFRGTMGRTAA